MIDQALVFLSDFLNQEIKLSYGIGDDKVVIGSLADPDGSISKVVSNKVVVSLINLEHITNTGTQKGHSAISGGAFGKKSPPVRMNLYVLVSANYDSSNYLEGLKMITSVIGAFQAQNVFDRHAHPGMHHTLDKLSLEIVNVPMKEYSTIWSATGAKYVPSVLYKVRLVTIEKDMIEAIIPGIMGMASKALKKD